MPMKGKRRGYSARKSKTFGETPASGIMKMLKRKPRPARRKKSR